MYTQVDKKIKVLAKLIGALFLIAGFVLFIIFLADDVGEQNDYLGVISLFAGIIGYISSWILYGFGQLVGDMQQTREASFATCVVINRISNLLESKAAVKNQQKDTAE